jgi:hypothetical protein
MDILDKGFFKAADFVTRDIAGETIIVPVRDGVGDLNSIYTLNELGTRVWQLVDGQTQNPIFRLGEAWDLLTLL